MNIFKAAYKIGEKLGEELGKKIKERLESRSKVGAEPETDLSKQMKSKIVEDRTIFIGNASELVDYALDHSVPGFSFIDDVRDSEARSLDSYLDRGYGQMVFDSKGRLLGLDIFAGEEEYNGKGRPLIEDRYEYHGEGDKFSSAERLVRDTTGRVVQEQSYGTTPNEDRNIPAEIFNTRGDGKFTRILFDDDEGKKMRRQEYTRIDFDEYKREDSLYTANGEKLPSQEVYRSYGEPIAFQEDGAVLEEIKKSGVRETVGRGSKEGKNDERNEMKRAQKSSNSSERKHSTQLNRGESR